MLREWREAPLLGIGTGAFSARFEQISGIPRVAPHNDYIGILVENGLAGLILYLAFQATVILTLLRQLVRFPERTGVTLAALVAFLATNVVNAINNGLLYVDIQLSILILVAAALNAAPTPVTAPVTAVMTPDVTR